MYINPCRRRLACLAAVAAQKSPFGRMTLISGPEALLADRAVAAIRRQILAEAPAAELTEIEAVRLDGRKLAEITSASLFSTQRAAVITNLAELPAELYPSLISLAATLSPIWPWWWCTAAGRRARGCWTSSGPRAWTWSTARR